MQKLIVWIKYVRSKKRKTKKTIKLFGIIQNELHLNKLKELLPVCLINSEYCPREWVKLGLILKRKLSVIQYFLPEINITPVYRVGKNPGFSEKKNNMGSLGSIVFFRFFGFWGFSFYKIFRDFIGFFWRDFWFSIFSHSHHSYFKNALRYSRWFTKKKRKKKKNTNPFQVDFFMFRFFLLDRFFCRVRIFS